MVTDRRASYYARSAWQRADDELAWLERFTRGMAVKRRARLGKQATGKILTLKRAAK